MTVDAIIVGCGPVGVTAAHLLGQYGISTLVMERDLAPYDLPRAVHLDHEIMRIFQSAGLDEMLLPHLTTPQGSVHFGMDGSPIRPFRRIYPDGKYGWANDYFFYQPDLERVLRAKLADRPTVELISGCAVVGIERVEGGVTVIAQTAGGEVRASARFVLACDGGRSTVRRLLGIELIDLGFDEPWIVVDAIVPGRARMPTFSGLPADVDVQKVMFIIGDPARPTSYVPSTGDHRRWEFMLLPGEDPEMAARPEQVEGLLRPWLAGVPHRIVRATTYRFHSLIAERWRAGDVFLLGDAAHQTPPFFGQGLCHGIRDAANLAWKLDLVLRGKAGDHLLSSYQAERLPHAQMVIETSMRTGRYVCTLDSEAARLRDARMRAGAGGAPPPELIPPLRAGVLDPRPDGPARGQRFVPPRVADADGRTALLDDITGGGFVMLATRGTALALLAEAESGLEVKPFLVVSPSAEPTVPAVVDLSGELGEWFSSVGCEGVIVRPDGYVYGTFVNDAGARSLLTGLARQLGRNVDAMEPLSPPVIATTAESYSGRRESMGASA